MRHSHSRKKSENMVRVDHHILVASQWSLIFGYSLFFRRSENQCEKLSRHTHWKKRSRVQRNTHKICYVTNSPENSLRCLPHIYQSKDKFFILPINYFWKEVTLNSYRARNTFFGLLLPLNTVSDLEPAISTKKQKKNKIFLFFSWLQYFDAKQCQK